MKRSWSEGIGQKNPKTLTTMIFVETFTLLFHVPRSSILACIHSSHLNKGTTSEVEVTH